MLLLDEIDKLPALGRDYPVEPVLLELLEPRQNMSFRDEYLDIGLNLTPFMTFIATANDLSKVSAPLQSRLRTFQVDLPTKEQMPAVARSLDGMIRSERPSFKRLFQPLSDEVITALQSIPPRELRRVLMEGYGYALHRSGELQRFIAVSLDDINKALKAGSSVAVSNLSPLREEQSAEVWAIVKFAKPPSGGNAPPGNRVH
jgi:ATP-dependent Lon protease